MMSLFSPLSSACLPLRWPPLSRLIVVLSLMLLPQWLAAAEPSRDNLISGTRLAQLLNQPEASLVVLDTRTQDDFNKSRIPHARWVDSTAWRSKTFEETGLSDRAYWATELGKLGLSDEQRIVVAGDSLPEAARAWWLLRYLGLEQVQLLDGGYKAWEAEAHPLTNSESSPTDVPAATKPGIEFQESMLASLEDVSPESLAKSQCKIVDNRSLAEFTGTRGVGTRTGHIPGAAHLEWQKFLGDDGKFLPAEAIQQILADAQIELDEPLVTHCQTGGRSSVAVLALELAGAKQVKNYYRGWSEYGDALTVPVEK